MVPFGRFIIEGVGRFLRGEAKPQLLGMIDERIKELAREIERKRIFIQTLKSQEAEARGRGDHQLDYKLSSAQLEMELSARRLGYLRILQQRVRGGEIETREQLEEELRVIDLKTI